MISFNNEYEDAIAFVATFLYPSEEYVLKCAIFDFNKITFVPIYHSKICLK